MSPCAHVLTVLNLKGGVGKTHCVWVMAGVCAERNLRMLCIDTDTQGNLSNSFLPQRGNALGIEQLLHPANEADLLPLIYPTQYPTIDIVPAGVTLRQYDLSDQRAWEAAELELSFVNAINSVRHKYDYIVFDCPPRLSLVSFAALTASDAVIVPLEAADWGAQGIIQVTKAVEYVQEHFNARLQILGYLISRFKAQRTYQRTYQQELRKVFGSLVFDEVLPDRAEFEKSVTDALLITQHAPNSSSAAIARRFFAEVERRLASQLVSRSQPSLCSHLGTAC
jgi:chromosome partitioning protein